MKKKLQLIVTILVLVISSSIPAYAYDYNDLGYFNADIFLQNELSTYSDEFEAAVDIWNEAGVLERSVVINTVSSSYIEDFDYADDENYWYEDVNEVYATYEPLSYYGYACSCHSVTTFKITLNEGEFAEISYSTSTREENARIGIIVHELGHAFELIDYENGEYWSSSVMDYRRVLYQIYEPQTRDINNANACWEVHRD